jgi:hypothetical protein
MYTLSRIDERLRRLEVIMIELVWSTTLLNVHATNHSASRFSNRTQVKLLVSKCSTKFGPN